MIALELTRVYDATPEQVFDAWLSPQLALFIGPRDITADMLEFDPRVGGRYRIAMHLPDRRDLLVGGVYRELERATRLVFSWKWEHEEVDTLVSLALRDLGGRTELTLRHENFALEERRDSHRQGWGSTLEKLALRLKKAAA